MSEPYRFIAALRQTAAAGPAPTDTVADVPTPATTAAQDPAPTHTVADVPTPATTAAADPAPTETTDKPWVVAWMREQAEHEARRAAREVSPRRRRRVTGPSVVLSIRVDPTELAALEGRAALLGMKPTVLARNLIRTGLASRGGEALLGTVERLDALVEELRGLVG